MPKQDGTGPAGQGPGTGRGRGRCARGGGAGTKTNGASLTATVVSGVVTGVLAFLADRRPRQQRELRKLPPADDESPKPSER